MERFVINGGRPLSGTMVPAGNKNAALPLLAACLLTNEPVILHNVPAIKDVLSMRKLLESLGVSIRELNSHSTLEIHAKDIYPKDLDPELCRNIRASILLAGPMIARFGELHLPPPGGDVIGRRRVDTHILALNELGTSTNFDGTFHFKSDALIGADILLDEASVTATENTIMASVLAKGETIIRNAASEPHIQELCFFLNKLGGNIRNIGSNTLHITGVSSLS
ncbi:MAG: UDP-N-acetylglucosamine 1-carboxyvinyltransferase, partial [Anaerolineaceae bacterium]|nr:UDP-N-acetylglucosamine 1-carboxyvinyltransferase [Anaerolineaceae bacterium]